MLGCATQRVADVEEAGGHRGQVPLPRSSLSRLSLRFPGSPATKMYNQSSIQKKHKWVTRKTSGILLETANEACEESGRPKQARREMEETKPQQTYFNTIQCIRKRNVLRRRACIPSEPSITTPNVQGWVERKLIQQQSIRTVDTRVMCIPLLQSDTRLSGRQRDDGPLGARRDDEWKAATTRAYTGCSAHFWHTQHLPHDDGV